MSLNPRLVSSRDDGRNCWVSFEFFVLSHLVIPPETYSDVGGGGRGVPVTPLVRGILFLFVCSKQKRNKTSSHAKILGLKSIQSLNDDTTAVSYQFFYLQKSSFERSPSFRHSTFVMPKPTFYSQYVLVLVAKWLIYAAICGFLYTWRLLILLHVLRSGRMAKWSEAPPCALGDVGCRFKSRRSNSYFFFHRVLPFGLFPFIPVCEATRNGSPHLPKIDHIKMRVYTDWRVNSNSEEKRKTVRVSREFELSG